MVIIYHPFTQIIFIVLFCFIAEAGCNDDRLSFSVISAVEHTCVVLLDKDEVPEEIQEHLVKIFNNEDLVIVSSTDVGDFKWPNNKDIEYVYHGEQATDRFRVISVLLFQSRKDVRPDQKARYPKALVMYNVDSANTLLDFVNYYCETYRTLNGKMNSAGIRAANILADLFSVEEISNKTMSYLSQEEPTYCLKQSIETCSLNEGKAHEAKKTSMPHCDKIDATNLTRKYFFSNYVEKSRPVILSNITTSWAAYLAWTRDYMIGKHGKDMVSVYLTPDGDFEGVEKAKEEENPTTPEDLENVQFPDLVLVRPARKRVSFESFLDMITEEATATSRNRSTYLEYTSIPKYFPSFLEDIPSDFDFIKGNLNLSAMNIWLSAGHTLGRIHFDEYENLLCQVSKIITIIYS